YLLEAHRMRDERVDLDVAVHVLLDHARELTPPLHAAERAAPPYSPRHELKRPRRDLLAGTRHADDRRLAPALMAALEGRPHQLRVADSLERVVDAAIRDVDDDFLNRAIVILRVDEIGGAELPRHRLLVGIDVDREDARRLGHHGPLNA